MKRQALAIRLVRAFAAAAASLSILVLMDEDEDGPWEAESLIHRGVAALSLVCGLLPSPRRSRERLDLAWFRLSPRELEFSREYLGGKSMKEIGADHGIRYSTVRNVFSSIYAKLGISGEVELFALGSSYEIVWKEDPG